MVVSRCLEPNAAAGPAEGGGTVWPLQDIVLLRIFCARINHSFIAHSHLHCPHYCNAIARLLRNIRSPHDPPFVCHAHYHIGNGNLVERPRHGDSSYIYINRFINIIYGCISMLRAQRRRGPSGRRRLGDSSYIHCQTISLVTS